MAEIRMSDAHSCHARAVRLHILEDVTVTTSPSLGGRVRIELDQLFGWPETSQSKREVYLCRSKEASEDLSRMFRTVKPAR